MNRYVCLILYLCRAVTVWLGAMLLISLIFCLIPKQPGLSLPFHSNTSDKIWILQYLDLLQSVVTWNFGVSTASHQPVAYLIQQGAKVSGTILLWTLSLTSIIALAGARFATFQRYHSSQFATLLLGTLLLSTSAPIYLLIGRWLFVHPLVNPLPGAIPTDISISLPCLLWLTIYMGPGIGFYKMVASPAIRSIKEAKSVALLQQLGNISLPIRTNLVIQLPFLMLGAILFEKLFGIPGIGSVIHYALHTADWPVVKAAIVVIITFYHTFRFCIGLSVTYSVSSRSLYL